MIYSAFQQVAGPESKPESKPKWVAGLFAALVASTAVTLQAQVLTGQAAFTDASREQPGIRRHLTVADLPKPFSTPSADNHAHLVPRPPDAWPKAPAGFRVELYAESLDNPREIRTAPNGDLFVAESATGKIRIFRGVTAEGKPQQQSVFASGLKQPFGIAFYPLGDNPKWVYVGDTDAVVRFAYTSGDMQCHGEPEVVAQVPSGGWLSGGGHWTRDLAFSLDGKTMFVSVGSHSNIDDPDTHSQEKDRADVLAFTPEGKKKRVYVSGVRNAVGIAVNPQTGELWGSVNERDGLGDNLVPDYITHFTPGGFYGWPWFYFGGEAGGTPDPRLGGRHPELRSKVLTPDVLLNPHFASLEIMFYERARAEAGQFPSQYLGDAFAAEHGSWNRAQRTGYEVIRVPMKNGHATGEYEDFLTGFTTAAGEVWGRPVGVAEANDGALFVSDDGSRSIWRVSYVGTSSGVAPLKR